MTAGRTALIINRPEREAHTLEALEALDFMMSGGLQPLAEPSARIDPQAKPRKPLASWSPPRDPVGLRGLLVWLRPLVQHSPD
jgi:hypothetical protein